MQGFDTPTTHRKPGARLCMLARRVSVQSRCASVRKLNVDERVAIEPGQRQSRSADADAPDPYRLRPERWLEQAARADD